MRYFGSKVSTASSVIQHALMGVGVKTAADAFGGLGVISSALRSRNIKVTTCDILTMPHAFQYTKIVCAKRPRYLAVRSENGFASVSDVIEYLNRSKDYKSWFVREFSSERMFFTRTNAAAIAGAWNKIRSWNDRGLLSTAERNHLISSFVNSMDKCANTAGTYYAHLKNWDRKALQRFEMRLLDVSNVGPKGEALQGDALDNLAGRRFDLLYLDPPYNNRDYASYYHLPESLSKLQRPDTEAHSKSGQPRFKTEASSQFRAALQLPYLCQLIESVHWKRLVVQYSDGSHIPLRTLRERLVQYGNLREVVFDALGYTTTRQERKQLHHVFIIDKNASLPS